MKTFSSISHVAVALTAVLVACVVVPTASAALQRPNVLVILTDDMRWDAMSCAGHPFFKTPNLDRLAAEGARFANTFVTTSLCSPSRASILSGQYARTHGVLNNFTEYPNDLPSYPRRLKDAGYETAYIGKWHMGEILLEEMSDARFAPCNSRTRHGRVAPFPAKKSRHSLRSGGCTRTVQAYESSAIRTCKLRS
jgi:arylsulfatase A-like enzyme